jgi:hypothetical protein
MSEEILAPGVIEVPTEVPVAPVSSSPPQAELPFPLNLSPSIENRDGECVIHPGACVPMFEGMEKCTLLPGSCFYFGMDYPDEVPPPQDSKPIIEVPKQKGKHMSDPHHIPVPEESPVVDHVPVHTPVAADTHASVGVADTPDVLKLAQQGPIAGNTIVLAGMAILGGGAAWKFYSQFTKQNHERKMAEIEKNSGNNEENKKRCEGHALAATNANRELQMKLDDTAKRLSDALAVVDTLKAKVVELEGGMNKAIRAGKNIDDLEERIEEMESKIKKKLKETSDK